MKTIGLIFILLTCLHTTAQNRDKIVEVSDEIRAMMDEVDSCVVHKEQNCIELLNKIIEKGEREEVTYMDYLYGRKAFYFWNNQKFDSVIAYGRKSLEHLNPVVSQRTDIDTYNLMANAYYFKGELNTAIKYYLKVGELLEDGGDPLHLGYLYSNIAVLLSETNNNEKQLEYLHKAFTLLHENNDVVFIATIASNLGLAYYYKQDTVKTLQWTQKALELSESSNDLMAKTQSYLTLSLIEKNLHKSLDYIEQSVRYADQLKDKTHQARAYYRYANILNQLKLPEKALEYAERAVNLSEEIDDRITLPKAAHIAATISYEGNQKEKAADFYYIYATLKDSISSAENTREINEINAKYETEKKEKQLAEQELKIQKQQSKLFLAILSGVLIIVIFGGIFIYNKKLQQSKLKGLQQEKEKAILNSFILGEERERKRISHELHDGIAAMIGAAKMSLESIPHLSQEKQMNQFSKVKQILENTHTEVRHIAHNLLPTVLEKEGLISATTHFISEINKTQLVNISLTDKNSQANQHSKTLQLMLFRIIQELVNNIIKHSQAQSAKIIFSKSENGLQIEIIDDGIGIEDTEDMGNQGLYSITQRLKAIGGSFKISKKSNGGTYAKVRLGG